MDTQLWPAFALVTLLFSLSIAGRESKPQVAVEDYCRRGTLSHEQAIFLAIRIRWQGRTWALVRRCFDASDSGLGWQLRKLALDHRSAFTRAAGIGAFQEQGGQTTGKSSCPL